jgi:hypothetical protein
VQCEDNAALVKDIQPRMTRPLICRDSNDVRVDSDVRSRSCRTPRWSDERSWMPSFGMPAAAAAAATSRRPIEAPAGTRNVTTLERLMLSRMTTVPGAGPERRSGRSVGNGDHQRDGETDDQCER